MRELNAPVLYPKVCLTTQERAMSSYLFKNVRIFDASGAQPYAGEVLVQGNRISRVARVGQSTAMPTAGVTVIDGAGATLMPGMVESHTHFAWNKFNSCHLRNTPYGRPV
jgi:predicted amidohydrolase YtcJ